MRKVVGILSLILLVIVGLAGCASIEKAKNFNGLYLTESGKTNVAHYNAQNWGIYLLSIPLITGDTEKEFSLSEKGVTLSSAFFKDTVNLDCVAAMLTKAAKDDGATMVTDMVSTRRTIWIAPLLVFFIRSNEISANGVR